MGEKGLMVVLVGILSIWSVYAQVCPGSVTADLTLTQDITSNGSTCITMDNDSITLDCNGFHIFFDPNGTGADGVVATNRKNITVKNCIILDINASGSGGTAIFFNTVNNSRIINNTVQTNGTDNNQAVPLFASVGNNITDNTIRTQGSLGSNYGVTLLSGSVNNIVSRNNISTNGTSDNPGIRSGATNNTFTNNIIITNGSVGTNHGIFVASSNTGCNVSNNTITTSGGTGNEGIHIVGPVSNCFIQFNTIFTGGVTNNFGIATSGPGISLNIINGNRIITNGSGTTNHGINFASGLNNRFINNNITTDGSLGSNYGIRITASTLNNSFDGNIIKTNGVLSSGIFISGSNMAFNNTLLDNPVEWINSTGAASSDNFTNTTFSMPDGSIDILPLAQIVGIQDITKSKLNISFNNAFLNSTNLSALNKSAQITLNNLTFNNPTPLVDFEDDGIFENCLSPICTEVSYNSSKDFVFNVSRFTSYSSEETIDCGAFLSKSSIMVENAAGNGTCITFNASNIVFDCRGFSIFFDANGSDNASGVLAQDFTNVTVKNCIIDDVNSSGAFGIGINFVNVSFSSIFNNTVYTNGTNNNYGINIESSISNTVANNIIHALGSTDSNFGINLFGADNLFDSNNITADGTFSYGILISGSNGSLFNNTLLDNPDEWINVSDDSQNNFSNTTFRQTFGSIDILPEVQINGSQDVTKSRLNISFNSAFLNSTNLSFFNTTAVITLNSLLFVHPHPIVDFEDDGSFIDCPASICTKLSYLGGILVFNTSRFTDYSSHEDVLIKTDNPDPVSVNGVLNYTILISLNGCDCLQGDNLTNITIVDAYPAGTVFINSSPAPDNGTNNTFSLGNLSVGQEASVNISVLVLPVFSNGTIITNFVNMTFQNESNSTITVSFSENTTVLAPVPPTPTPSGGGGGGGSKVQTLICPSYCNESRYAGVYVCQSEACTALRPAPEVPAPVALPSFNLPERVEKVQEPVAEAKKPEIPHHLPSLPPVQRPSSVSFENDRLPVSLIVGFAALIVLIVFSTAYLMFRQV
ncbi:Right handed beta helix region [uncultured archaeon]|nr:Right handed beta helix region [uncultured archaeon]